MKAKLPVRRRLFANASQIGLRHWERTKLKARSSRSPFVIRARYLKSCIGNKIPTTVKVSVYIIAAAWIGHGVSDLIGVSPPFLRFLASSCASRLDT